jgi:hypothetical protein
MKYRDENGDASLQLPDKLSNSYKNYVCKGQDFIMVACRNKLYTFSLHQNPKGESNNVIAACNGKNGLCYFITLDNKLYAVGKDENRAKPVGKLTLAIGEKPVKFHAGEKYLWLITNNSLYKINPDNAETSYEIGIKGSDAKKKISEKKIDFRSIREDNGQLFLGTRNCLLRVKLDTPEKIDIIPTARNTNADCSDLYITDISENNCFASMRHGIFVLNEKDSLDKISGSDSIGDIRRFIRRNDDYSYLYTSKGVYEWKHDGFKKKDNIHPEFVSTVYDRESGFFIVGYKGIIAAGTKDDFIRSINRNLGISANEAAIAEAADRKTLFVGTQTGLYKLGENNSLTLIEIPPKNYTVLYFTLLAIGLIIVVFMTVFHYFHQKRLIKNKLKRYGEKIAEHIKKEKSKELNLRKEELENSLKTVNIAGIGKLNKEIKAFEARIEEVLIKRKEIIGSLKTIIDSKIKEIGRITVDDDDSKHEWNEILKAADKTENEDNNEYSIDYSFALYRRISKYEKNYIKKTAVTQRMSVRQKKDFGELHKIFIVREERKEGENEQEKKARQTREETIRNRIKSKCEELLEKYREDLDDLKLKSNTKKSYVSLLLISGKFDNADIEKTMKFSRVGDDRYKLHEELKQKTGRNALLEQLYQHTKPQK